MVKAEIWQTFLPDFSFRTHCSHIRISISNLSSLDNVKMHIEGGFQFKDFFVVNFFFFFYYIIHKIDLLVEFVALRS